MNMIQPVDEPDFVLRLLEEHAAGFRRDVEHLRQVVELTSADIADSELEGASEVERRTIRQIHEVRRTGSRRSLEAAESTLAEIERLLAFLRTTTGAAILSGAAVIDSDLVERDAPELVTELPAGWERLSSAELEELYPKLDDADADEVLDELAKRNISDDRIAQATGNAFGEVPS